MTSRKNNFSSVFLFILILTISSVYIFQCAYYNTFYNAKQAYKRGLEAVKNSRNAGSSSSGGQGNGDFQRAIEKASKVLEIHSKSKYVDDALLLLGKSFYFTDQHEEALRKFDELKSNFPESNLVAEGELYRGKILISRRSFFEAEEVFRSVAERETSEDIQFEIRLSLAELLESNDKPDDAIAEYQRIIDTIKKKEIQAKAQFAKGECYMELEQYEKAAEEFKKVPQYKPDFLLKFQSGFNYAVAQKLSKNIEEAKKIYFELLKNSINFEFFPDIELELADCLFLQGQNEAAKEAYNKIILENPKTEFSQKGHFEIGEIFANSEFNFDSALVHYQTAQKEKANTDLIEEINLKVTLLTSVTLAYKKIKAINIGGQADIIPDTSASVGIQDSVITEEEIMIPEYLPIEDQPQVEGSIEGFARTIEYPFEAATALISGDIKTKLLIGIEGLVEEVNIVRDIPKYEFAKSVELGARTMQFTPAFKDGKRVKFWLEVDFKFKSKGSGRDEEIVEIVVNRKAPPKENRNETELSITKNLAKDGIIKIDNTAEFQEATERYVVSEFFLDISEIDSALYHLHLIAERCKQTDLAPKSIYLIAHIYQEYITEPDSSKKFYDYLLEQYPETSFAQAAWEETGNTGKFNKEKEKILEEFISIEKTAHDNGDYEEAISAFLEFAEKHPESDLAPKSLFSIAWIYREKLNDLEKAIKYYKYLAENYEDIEYGIKAREILNQREKYLQAINNYLSVERSLTEKIDYHQAVAGYSQIALSQKASENGAKSSLISGWLYQDAIGDIQKAIAKYIDLRTNHPYSKYSPIANNIIESISEYFKVELEDLPSDEIVKRQNRSKSSFENRAVPENGLEDLKNRIGYPIDAFKNLIEDTLIIKISVTEEGEVEKAELYSDKDNKTFTIPIIEEITNTRFIPATDDGKQKESTLYYEFKFHISDSLFSSELIDYETIGLVELTDDKNSGEPEFTNNIDSILDISCYPRYDETLSDTTDAKEISINVKYTISSDGRILSSTAIIDSATALSSSVAAAVRQFTLDPVEKSGLSIRKTYLFRYTFTPYDSTIEARTASIPPLLPEADRPVLFDPPEFLTGQITYPDSAIDSRGAGLVILDLLINEQGNVDKIMTVSDPGYGLADSVRKVFISAKFQPGRYNESQVKSWLTVKVNFRLKPIYELADSEIPQFFPFDSKPVLLDTVSSLISKIDYPESAAKDSVIGSVIAKIHIDKQGKARDIIILRSPGEIFSEQIISAVNNHTFSPAVLNKRLINSWNLFKYDFSYKNKKSH